MRLHQLAILFFAIIFSFCSQYTITKKELIKIRQEIEDISLSYNRKIEEVLVKNDQSTKNILLSHNTEIEGELAEIHLMLIELNQKLENLNNNCKLDLTSYETKVNSKELEKIILPENPTKNQILEYIRKICIASAKQKSYSSNDPQVSMLIQIGHENLELLLAANFDKGVDLYAITAILFLVQPEDKKLILEYLPYKKYLVKVVTQNGWEKDAKSILYNGLKQMPPYLPTEWIQAIANLHDPSIYEDLKRYLILGSNKKWTYEAIKTLPGINLEDTVIQAWKNTKHGSWDRKSFAPIAFKYGQEDALPVINSLQND